MTEVEGVTVKFEADDRPVKRAFKDLGDGLGKAERQVADSKRRVGVSAFAGGALGGFAGAALGFLSDQVQATQAVGSILDTFANVLIAALLPALQGLIPVLQGLASVLMSPPIQGLIGGAGDLIGGGGKLLGGDFTGAAEDIAHGLGRVPLLGDPFDEFNEALHAYNTGDDSYFYGTAQAQADKTKANFNRDFMGGNPDDPNSLIHGVLQNEYNRRFGHYYEGPAMGTQGWRDALYGSDAAAGPGGTG